MEYQRTSHAVYELKYHLVWAPKFRKIVLSEPVARRLKAIFRGIAERYGFAIVEQEVMPDHVHLFVSAPPRWSPAELVNVLKGVSARQLRKESSPLREATWGGSLWSDGYFVRATGDAVTADIIQRYIRYQRRHEEGPRQLRFNF
jgi:putative transposase